MKPAQIADAYSAKEVCDLLQILPMKLARYREALGEQVSPRRWGHYSLFTAGQLEILKAFHAQQPVRARKPFPGLRSSDVARRLDLPQATWTRSFSTPWVWAWKRTAFSAPTLQASWKPGFTRTRFCSC